MTAATSGTVLVTTSAVLSQDRENDLWQTTVILSQVAGQCPGPGKFWLETTSPDKEIPASSVNRVGVGPCCVQVKFKGAPRTMESALLVLDEAGVLSSAQLSLARDVTWYDYFGVPIIGGLLMAIALLFVIGFLIGVREEDGTRRTLINRQFRTKTVAESEIPKVRLVPIATVVAAFLGAGTLANSLFPGVSVGVFLLLTTALEAGAAAVGLALYYFLQEGWVRRCRPNELGSPLALTASSKQPPDFSFPTGADITSDEELVITPDQASSAAEQASTTGKIQIPPDSKVEILRGESLSFPDGPKILLKGAGSLLVSKNNASLTLTTGTYKLPAVITAKIDALITYDEKAEPIFYPRSAKVGRRRYGNKSFTLTLKRPAVPQVNMLIAMVPVLVTVFAVGAELGIIGVLSISLSDATGFGRFVASDLIAAVALFVLYYIVRNIRSTTYT